jgi:hypothetical protein
MDLAELIKLENESKIPTIYNISPTERTRIIAECLGESFNIKDHARYELAYQAERSKLQREIQDQEKAIEVKKEQEIQQIIERIVGILTQAGVRLKDPFEESHKITDEYAWRRIMPNMTMVLSEVRTERWGPDDFPCAAKGRKIILKNLVYPTLRNLASQVISKQIPLNAISLYEEVKKSGTIHIRCLEFPSDCREHGRFCREQEARLTWTLTPA